MIENARRQVILILLVAGFAVYSLLTSKINLGLDLQGGTQLVYNVNVDKAREEGLIPSDATQDDISRILDETVKIIRERIDPTGTLEAVVTRRGDTGILIELHKMTESAARAVEARIESLGRLELRMVVSTKDASFTAAGVRIDLRAEKQVLQTWLDKDDGANKKLVQEDPRKIAIFNRLAEAEGGSALAAAGHLAWFPGLIEPSPDNERLWGRADSWTIQGPRADSPCVPAFGALEFNGGEAPPRAEGERPPFLVEFYPINMDEKWFRGEDLDPAAIRPSVDERGRPCILYKMKPEQIDAYAEWSEKWVKERSAIILNGDVHSAPEFQGRIRGNAQITGEFTPAQVDELVKVLRTGSLKVRPIPETRLEIGPTLGQRSINLGMYSIGIGGVLVLGFILAYYRLAGIVAFVGILLNVLLILGTVLWIDATLTLPGIAGLVLTMGMAVDSNILIYERIREELERGKQLLQATRTGFERAMVTIIDANATTFIAGMVLFNAGVGPIRGFAVTLMIGIATTVYSAFFATRVAFHYLIENKWLTQFRVATWLRDVHFDWLRWAKPAIWASIVVMVVGLVNAVYFVPRDTKMGLDFTGGANLRVVLTEPITRVALLDRLARDAEFNREFPSPYVNTVGAVTPAGATSFSIKLKLKDDLRAEIDRLRMADPDYVPPYITGLERALSGLLVQPAFGNAAVFEKNATAQYAELELHFARDVKLSDAQDLLRARFGGEVVVASMDDESASTARNLRLEFDVAHGIAAEELFPQVSDALQTLLGADGQPVKLSNPIPESEEIGGRMVGELRNAAITSLLLSMFLIVMYIRVRFHEYKYGIAAVVALLHDLLISVGAVVFFNSIGLVNAELDLAMIAAFLTVIGYSINDTIVIFDRVRENLNEQKRLGERIDFHSLMNLSINQTLSRTVLTTSTTLFVVLAQFVVNYGETTVLAGFSFALLVGIASGTYSTVFVAGPILEWLWKRGQAAGGSAAGASTAEHPPHGTPVPAKSGV